MTIYDLEHNEEMEVGDCFLIVRVASRPIYGTEHLERGDKITYAGINTVNLSSYSVPGTDAKLCLSGDTIVEKCKKENNQCYTTSQY